MPSPFPGMNPYLEQPAAWQDFHTTFLVGLRARLNQLIRPRYYAKVEEHIYIHDFDESPRPFARADVAIVEGDVKSPRHPAGVALQTEPQHVWLPGFDEERLVAIEVIDRESGQVVTVVELLSPTNKHLGKDRDLFISRRHQLLKSDVHYVEMDLRRGGPRLPWEGLQPCDYYFLVSRAGERPRADIWPFGLRDAFPPLHVPLRSGEPDVVVDVKRVFDTEFDSVGYEQFIYNHEPEPPLSATDRVWAVEILRNSRKT